jgi:hypothetical protein
MEASNVPIVAGSLQDMPPDLTNFPPTEDFGWHGSDKDLNTLRELIKDFVTNTGDAQVGSYFGNSQGWPRFYNPNPDEYIIPSGANVFDLSPLDIHGQIVHTSNYSGNYYLISSSGNSRIRADAGGVVESNTMLRLDFLTKTQRDDFFNVLTDMNKDKFFAKTSTNMELGQVTNFVKDDSNTNLPAIKITVKGPAGDARPASFIFYRPVNDYATTAITNLWYSWAQWYVNLPQFKNFTPQTAPGTFVYKNPATGGPGDTLTNEITFPSLPPGLAVGMKVTAPDNPTTLPDKTTILKIEGTTVYLSRIPIPTNSTPMMPQTQNYKFERPEALPIDATSAQYTKPYGDKFKFSDAEMQNAILFAGGVYESLQVQSVNLPPSPYLPTTMNTVAHVIKFWAAIPDFDKPWGPTMVGEARDIVKSILRGVYDYYKIPDQSLWYPDPAKETGNQKFNVYNLNPYVWFCHKIANLDGYAFSVDDDVANPSATGPRGPEDQIPAEIRHLPNNLQVGFAGIKGTGALSNAIPLGNQNEWFPMTRWGKIDTMATIGVWNSQNSGGASPQYDGYSYIELTPTQMDPDVFRTLNKILTPGPGQVGAYINAPGFIVPGTTLIFFPEGVIQKNNSKPTIILSQNAISTATSIPITIDATQFVIPTAPIRNQNFSTPQQNNDPYYTVNPKGANVYWTFTGSAGIAANQSIYAKNNPAPVGTQVGFLQNQSSISQSLKLAAGQAYAVSFQVAQRKLDNGMVNAQTLEVRVGNNLIGKFKPSGSTYVLFTSDAFTVPKAGTYVITITGTNQMGGDNTALIDDVTVTGGPPPKQSSESRAAVRKSKQAVANRFFSDADLMLNLNVGRKAKKAAWNF